MHKRCLFLSIAVFSAVLFGSKTPTISNKDFSCKGKNISMVFSALSESVYSLKKVSVKGEQEGQCVETYGQQHMLTLDCQEDGLLEINPSTMFANFYDTDGTNESGENSVALSCMLTPSKQTDGTH